MSMNEDEVQERTPHKDGRLESIISDTTAMAGEQMGIRNDVNPENFSQPKNPFHLNPTKDEEMERFSKFFDGKKE